MPASPPSDSARIIELRARLARLERADAAAPPAVLPLGVPAIDAALAEGGLRIGALHEVTGAPEGRGLGRLDAAPFAFTAWLCGRLAQGRTILWVESELVARRPGLPAAAPYAPAWAGLGLDAGQVVLVRASRDAEALWAAEEGLRSTAVAAVVTAVDATAPTSARRLQLAAEATGTTGFLLRPPGSDGAVGAVSRWQVASRPAGEAPGCAWHLRLVRARHGRAGEWNVRLAGTAIALEAGGGCRLGRAATARP